MCFQLITDIYKITHVESIAKSIRECNYFHKAKAKIFDLDTFDR